MKKNFSQSTLSGLLGLVLISLMIANAFSQTPVGHHISVKIAGLRDSTCYLAHAYEAMYAIQDTAKADANGAMVFKGAKKLPGGLYTLAIGKGATFDILISDDQDFEVQTDTVMNYRKNLKFTGSTDNELFTEFQNHWMQEAIKKQTVSDVQKKEIDKALETYQKEFVKKHEGTFVASILKANMGIDIPPLAPKATRQDTLAQASYYWNHFWDNFNLGDEKMLRTPFLKPRLDYFLENISYFSSDSTLKVLDRFLAKTKKNSDLRKYLVMRSTYNYEVPKMFILGNDTDVNFIYLAEKYYVNEPTLWNDTSIVRKIKERVEILKPLVIGKKIPNMMLTDTLGKVASLWDVKAKYTVVFMYSPDCHHCQEATPKLVKAYQDLKAKGIDIKIYAPEIDRKEDKWKKFIHEYKTQPFINVTDHYTVTDFNKVFDARTTPTMYIVDKDKKIIAKKIAAEQVEDLIMAVEKQEQKKMK